MTNIQQTKRFSCFFLKTKIGIIFVETPHRAADGFGKFIVQDGEVIIKSGLWLKSHPDDHPKLRKLLRKENSVEFYLQLQVNHDVERGTINTNVLKFEKVGIAIIPSCKHRQSTKKLNRIFEGVELVGFNLEMRRTNEN